MASSTTVKTYKQDVKRYETFPRHCLHPEAFSFCQERPINLLSSVELLQRELAKHPDDELLRNLPAWTRNSILCAKHSHSIIVEDTSDRSSQNDQTNMTKLNSHGSPMQFGSDGMLSLPFSFGSPSLSSATFIPNKDFDSEDYGVSESVSRFRIMTFNNGKKEVISLNPDEEGRSPITNAHEERTKGQSLSDSDEKRSEGAASKSEDPVTPSRPSLSPENSRSSVRRRSSSRSPSPAVRRPLSPRGVLAYKTMKGDNSYERPVSESEQAVIDLLATPIRTKDWVAGEKGWVYLVRDPELELIKVGFTTQEIPTRVKGISYACKPSDAGLIIVGREKCVPTPAYRRLEQLVHADLKPHRWYYDCACGLSRQKKTQGYTTHQEWYDVSDEVAISTLGIWRDFILSEPYHKGEVGNGGLKTSWSDKISRRQRVPAEETPNDHAARYQRWRTLFGTANPADDGKTESNEHEERSSSSASSPNEPKQQSSLPAKVQNQHYVEDPKIKSEREEGQDPELASIPAIPSIEFPDSAPEAPMESPNLVKCDADNKPKEVEDTTTNCSNSTPKARDLTNLMSTLDALLRKRRTLDQAGSIYEDLLRFRWPLVCMWTFSFYSPFLPPVLSVVLWSIMLPFLVGELREWV